MFVKLGEEIVNLTNVAYLEPFGKDSIHVFYITANGNRMTSLHKINIDDAYLAIQNMTQVIEDAD